MKKILFLLILTHLLVFLTGCWDYNEIEEVALVSSFAIDIDSKTGEYILNVEVVDVEEGPKGTKFIPSLIEIRGETIFDAFRNSIALTTKKLYFSHASIIVVSQDFAKEGIIPILDWLSRQKEPRITFHIYISKKNTAKEILLKEDKSTKIRTIEAEEIIEASKYLAKSPHIEAYQITNQIIKNKISSVLPTVDIVNVNGKDSVLIQGSAYFKADKLIGIFDPMETMKYLLVVDQLKQGILIIEMDEKNNKDKVSLEILKNKTKTDINIENQEISVTVRINTFASIQEIDSGINYSSKEGRTLLIKKVEIFMEKEIEKFIASVQDRGIDVFGFGDSFSKKHPKIWREIEKDWDSIFRDLDIKVVSTINIKSGGHISTPITIGE